MTNETATAKVFSAALEVSRALGREGIGKRSSNGLRYSYRSIEDVLAALNPLLHQHHLIIFPEKIEQAPEQTVSTQKGGVQRLVRATVTYRFVSTEDGSFFTVQTLGEGLDSSDKASGKAMSYAFKNAMFQVFCIPVYGMPDPDAEQATAITAPPVPQDLLDRARDAAMCGLDSYKTFFKGLKHAERKTLVDSGEHEKLKEVAGNGEGDGNAY